MPSALESAEGSRKRVRPSPSLLSGLVLVVLSLSAAMAYSAPMESTQYNDRFAAPITKAARRFGIPEGWIRAVLRAESAGDVRAISAKGAMGLMQIMPETWQDLRIRYRLGSDLFDPHDNILAGTAYLRELHNRYGTPGFLAAYNAGPGRYETYLAGGRPLPAETWAYVETLMPFIGASKVRDPIKIVAADPGSWSQSSLFSARIESLSAADPLRHERYSADVPATPPIHGRSAMEPRSEGLFIPRSGTGGS